jgi:hypothetical protein
MIRQLPAGFALVIRGGCAPVIARLPRAWKNRAYRRARLGRLPAAQAAADAPYPVFVPPPRGIPDHTPAEDLHEATGSGRTSRAGRPNSAGPHPRQ